jgi:3-dehydroquinate synthase
MRGVPLVQVPTTLTAQVDAAIGGKCAVNLPEGKNLVGVFAQPVAVLADVSTLATLPEREYRSGLAEVAKYALALDPELLASLEADPGPVLARDPAALEELVARCAGAKAATVAADERDAGPRLVLNYGHTLGHALERLEAFAGRTHGEAVAVGMIAAAEIGRRIGVTPPALVERQRRLLERFGLPTRAPGVAVAAVQRAMALDKKVREGGLRWVLLEDVGRPVVRSDVPLTVVEEVLASVLGG